MLVVHGAALSRLGVGPLRDPGLRYRGLSGSRLGTNLVVRRGVFAVRRGSLDGLDCVVNVVRFGALAGMWSALRVGLRALSGVRGAIG